MSPKCDHGCAVTWHCYLICKPTGHPASYLALKPETITPCFLEVTPWTPAWQLSGPWSGLRELPWLPQDEGYHTPYHTTTISWYSWQECQLALTKRDDLLPLLFLAPTASSQEVRPPRKDPILATLCHGSWLVLIVWGMRLRQGF